MTASQRVQLGKELIERLTSIYRSVRDNISAHTIEKAMRADPTDGAEESAIDELRALDADLGERDRRLAHAIEDALRRLPGDEFGICIDCGKQIPFERLRAVPWTLRCAEDEARVERRDPHHPTL
jgi:DnaK suppressor protein